MVDKLNGLRSAVGDNGSRARRILDGESIAQVDVGIVAGYYSAPADAVAGGREGLVSNVSVDCHSHRKIGGFKLHHRRTASRRGFHRFESIARVFAVDEMFDRVLVHRNVNLKISHDVR